MRAPRFFSRVGIIRHLMLDQRECKSVKREHEIRMNQSFAATISSASTSFSLFENHHCHQMMEDRPPLQIHKMGGSDLRQSDREVTQEQVMPIVPTMIDAYSDSLPGSNIRERRSNEDEKLIWYQHWDDGHGAYYYWNVRTNESTWLEPSEQYYASIEITRPILINKRFEGSQIYDHTRDTSFPREFECSITLEVMADPVIGADGYAYERAAIEEWFIKNDSSPTTNKKIEHKNLVPNRSLKALISSYTSIYVYTSTRE